MQGLKLKFRRKIFKNIQGRALGFQIHTLHYVIQIMAMVTQHDMVNQNWWDVSIVKFGVFIFQKEYYFVYERVLFTPPRMIILNVT